MTHPKGHRHFTKKKRRVCPTVFSDVDRMLRRVQCIVQVRRENSSRNSISLTKQNRQCFNSLTKEFQEQTIRKVRHHRARRVFPHSEEPNNSSRSTACRFRTAQTTRRDVSKLIKMFDGIYQHFKQLSSQRSSHVRHVEKEE